VASSGGHPTGLDCAVFYVPANTAYGRLFLHPSNCLKNCHKIQHQIEEQLIQVQFLSTNEH